MLIKNTRIKLKDAIFFSAYGIFLVFSILSTTFYYKYFIGIPFNLIIVFCVGLLMLKEFIGSRYNMKSIVGAIVCVLLILFTWKNSSGAMQNTVACIFIFVYCGRDISFEKIVKFSLYISSCILLFVILSSYIGIIDNYVYINSEGRVRHYLGFRYSLYAPAIFFNIVSIYIYMKKTKITLLNLVVLLGVDFFFFSQTDSRLSFVLTALLIVIAFIFKLKPMILKKRKIICRLMILSFIICFFGILYLTINYNSSVVWQANLNEFLGTRLSLGKQSLIENNISLMGREVTWVGNGLDAYGKRNSNTYTYVDSLYIQILQRYGIIFTFLIVTMITFTIAQCYKKEDYYMMVILTVLALHGTVDDLILYLHYNTFWFAIGNVLMGQFKKIQPLTSQAKKKKRIRIKL